MRVPSVSVVVPVYNTQPYLPECLDSLLEQTIDAFEIICVEDGSTDGSPAILDRYTRLDSRVRVIRRAEVDRGPGAARNDGISRARGSYLAFVDSDDRVRPEMLESLVSAAERHGSDVVMCTIRTFDGKEEHQTPCSHDQVIPTELDDVPFTWRALGPELFRLRFASCNKIYRREFLERRSIRFAEDQFYEDLVFTFRALLEAESLAFVRQPLYLNRKGREGSTTFDQSDRVFDALSSLHRLREILEGDETFAELVPSFHAFEFRKLTTYLAHNDLEHIEPFYAELKRVASQEPLCSSPYLTVEERRIKERIAGSDLYEYLVWNSWFLQTQNRAVHRRLARAQAQRERFRSQVQELRAENQWLRDVESQRTPWRRMRRRLRPIRRLAERVVTGLRGQR